jgi:hypothetical protein
MENITSLIKLREDFLEPTHAQITLMRQKGREHRKTEHLQVAQHGQIDNIAGSV